MLHFAHEAAVGRVRYSRIAGHTRERSIHATQGRAFRRIGIVALLGALSLSAAGCANRGAHAPLQNDLRVVGNTVIEMAPVDYAISQLGAAEANAGIGGIQKLYDGSNADLAGHAETQGLRNSLSHPDLRIILTITEGHYNIVAKRSAGIRSMADLRGKRIATPPLTSAAFYLQRALDTAGMTEADVVTVPIPTPPKNLARLLLDGQADAIALWDPEPQIAIRELGDDAIILDPETPYRELYNLNTTAAKLADPITRAKIVRFVAKLIEASEKMRDDEATGIALAAARTGYPADLIRASWAHHVFSATLSPALLDTMVAEEAWLARHDGRRARTREELGVLIDPSIEAEARAMLAKGQ